MRLIKGEETRYLSAYGLDNVRGVTLARYLFPVSYLTAILFCAFSKIFAQPRLSGWR